LCRKPLTGAARRFHSQSDPAIAVVIVKKPAERFTAHLETQVAATRRYGPRFGQRVEQRNDLPAASGRGGGLVLRTRFAHDSSCFDLGLVTLAGLPMYACFKAVISSLSILSMACITRSDFRHFPLPSNHKNGLIFCINLRQHRFSAIRALTSFFTSIIGSGLSGEKRIVPLLVWKSFRSCRNSFIAAELAG
jgi:hypothetical protein